MEEMSNQLEGYDWKMREERCSLQIWDQLFSTSHWNSDDVPPKINVNYLMMIIQLCLCAFIKYILTLYYMSGAMTGRGNIIINKTGKFLALMKFALKTSVVECDSEKQLFYNVSSAFFP